jgi:hypothetical protein
LISEIRQVIFDRQALEIAVVAADKEDGGRLYEYASLRVSIEKEPEIRLVIEAQRTTSEAPERIEMAPAHIAALMIRHCRRERIPLPRGSKKSLELAGANLCLRVTMNVATKHVVVPWSPASTGGTPPKQS